MSLILTAVAVAALCASAGGGYLFASLRGGSKKPPKDEDEDKGSPGKRDGSSRKDGSSPMLRKTSERRQRDSDSAKRESRKRRGDDKRQFEALPLALGDVVLAEGEERWLAGAILASEAERVIASLFFAPEGSRTKVVVAFARPRRDLYWLAPATCDSPAEPPASCELDGTPMTRRSRLPVTLSRKGQGTATVGEDGILAEYDGGADEVGILLTSEGRAHAFVGRRLVEGDYDRLGSGGEDEDP
ncbi:MAG: hypothetical protein R3B70_41480 [Polyangiaceae bacterium]